MYVYSILTHLPLLQPSLASSSLSLLPKGEYISFGKVKVNRDALIGELEKARKAATPYKMARKLMPHFFTKEELRTQTCVSQKPGKESRPQAEPEKLKLLFINNKNLKQ